MKYFILLNLYSKRNHQIYKNKLLLIIVIKLFNKNRNKDIILKIFLRKCFKILMGRKILLTLFSKKIFMLFNVLLISLIEVYD